MAPANSKNSRGFALIGLVIAVAIIALLAVMYYGKSGDDKKSAAKTGNEAIQQTKQNNELLLDQHLETQNQINSIE